MASSLTYSPTGDGAGPTPAYLPPTPGRCRGKSGFGFPNNSSNLIIEEHYGRVPADMSGTPENSDLKYVGIVALIIGGTVLVLGIMGIAMSFS